jgi:hypothetical protein
MNRLVLLSALSVGLAGCDTTKGFLAPSAAEKAAKPIESRPAFRPPVVADQVNTENAKDKAKALNDELDRDLQSAIDARDKDK